MRVAPPARARPAVGQGSKGQPERGARWAPNPASRARSRARRSGIRSSAQPKRSTTRASIAGSPSTARRSRRSSPAGHRPPRAPPPPRRPPPSRRPADMPLTTAALEQITRPIVTALYPRRYGLKNQERLNRLLMLQQLHINGDDAVQAYAKTIRTWLEAPGGRPTAHRRAIADPAGSPS